MTIRNRGAHLLSAELFKLSVIIVTHALERWKIFIYNRFMEIPAAVRTLLWEYSLEEIPSGDRWQSAIIERVMQRGCWDDMLWLLRAFDRERLRVFLERRGRRALAPRELRFWATVCGVPIDDQDTWVIESRARERAWR
jgi:hypothetical protein